MHDDLAPPAAAGPALGDRAVSFAYPSAGLDEIVERHWWLEPGRPLTIHLWPGTGAEVLWPDGPASFACGDRTYSLRGPVLLALRSQPAVVTLAGATSLLAVRLRASALARLGVDTGGYVDRARPFPSATDVHADPEPAERPRSLAEGRAYFETELRHRRDRAPLARIAESIEAYYRAPAALTVPEAAELAAVSERQLRRDFLVAVGVAPKRFQRLVRFQRTFRSLLLDGRRAVTAPDVGYVDQSHQLRDFTAFTGSTPSALQRTAPPHTYFRSRR